MSADSRKGSYELEYISVADGLGEFGREDGGHDDVGATFEIVESPIVFTPVPPAAQRRAVAKHHRLRRTAKAVAAAAAQARHQTAVAVRRFACQGRAALGATADRAIRQVSAGTSRAGVMASRLARLAHARSSRFHPKLVLRVPRSAVGALAATALAFVIVPWIKPAASPARAVSSSAVAKDSPLAAGTAATAIAGVTGTASVRPAPAAARTTMRPIALRPRRAAVEPRRSDKAGPALAARPRLEHQTAVVPAVAETVPAEATEGAAPASAVPAASYSTDSPGFPAAEPTVLGRTSSIAALDTVAADRAAIEDVLSSYRRSYNAMDTTAMSAIWQGLDTQALTRAFSSLSRQHLLFERCDVRVTGAERAAARCHGLLSFVPKTGNKTPQQRRVSWEIEFRRAAGDWSIVSVQAR